MRRREPRFAQQRRQTRFSDRHAVHLLDLDAPARGGDADQRLHVLDAGIAMRQQALAAALQVKDETAVVDHAVGARRSGHPTARVGPGQHQAVGVGRVGGRKRNDAASRLAERSQAIHRARQRELRASKPFHEVTAANAARLLHRPQDRI